MTEEADLPKISRLFTKNYDLANPQFLSTSQKISGSYLSPHFPKSF
jgi:hypothetical protein